MHLSEWVFRRKAIFKFLLFALTVGGVLSYHSLSKLEDPEIVVMVARVITVYPGASAHEVEMQVTNVLEKKISELADIESIRSRSAANVSEIDVELKMTVPQDQIEQRWEFMRRKLAFATERLPPGAMAPMVFDDIGDVYGMFYAMTAEGFSYQEMARQAEFIRRSMLDVEGVRKAEVYGEQPPTLDIILSPERMARLGVMPAQVVMAINDQNAMVFAGNHITGGQQLRVVVNDRIASPDDLGNVLVQTLDGRQVRLADLATLRQGYREPRRNTMYLNNTPALGISISMESGENILEVGRRVEQELAQLKQGLPAGFEFTKVFFQPDRVRASINDFIMNLVQSVGVVIVVLMLTMGLRTGMIIGTGLLLTILGTFPLLLATDGSLQRISLGAFIVAMGMLVDNAIVVIDAIRVNLQTGRRSKRTFVNVGRRAAMPLLGATLIAVTAFLPVFLSRDAAGTYARDLFIVLCFSLLISWLLALTQVPYFAASFLKKVKPARNNDPYSGPVFRLVQRALSFFLLHKTATVVVALLLLGAAAYGYRHVKQTFFPDFNYNQVYIEYMLPHGACPNRVNQDLASITSHFLTLPEVLQVVTSQGMTPTRYSLVRPLGEVGDNYGELIVDFKDYETMIRMKPVLDQYLRAHYPDARARIRKYSLSIKSSHLVEVEFTGPDPAVLRNLSAQAEAIMRANPYTNKHTIGNNWEPMGMNLVALFNQPAARMASVTRSDVGNALLAATDGLPLGTVYQGETPIAINLKIRGENGERLDNLHDIPVWGMIPSLGGLEREHLMMAMQGLTPTQELAEGVIRSVPLSAVTTGLQPGWEEPVVHRVNGKRSIQAQSDPLDGHSPAQVRASMLREIRAIELPEGYSYRWVGEYEMQGAALGNIFRFLPIAVILIILILIVLFNDFKRPIIVIACIPMAAIGIVPGLIITGQPFTFMAIIGSIGLIGMLIKNSIVLLDEIALQIKGDQEPYQAIVRATVSRTRPVILASLTTILGMLPLIADPMYSSMAVAVISGLLVGTVITLIFVPILYAVLYRTPRSRGVRVLTD